MTNNASLYLKNLHIDSITGKGAYVLPYVIEVQDLVDNTEYEVSINDMSYSYNSGAGATILSVLEGIKTLIEQSLSPSEIQVEIFEVETAPYLRIKQGLDRQPFLAYGLSSNLSSSRDLYLALYKGDPLDGGQEVSGYGYKRQIFETLDRAELGFMQNSNFILFGPADGGAWGEVTHGVLCDQYTGGNILLSGQVNQSKEVEENISFIFFEGDVTFTF